LDSINNEYASNFLYCYECGKNSGQLVVSSFRVVYSVG
jgi:hypothetical protein